MLLCIIYMKVSWNGGNPKSSKIRWFLYWNRLPDFKNPFMHLIISHDIPVHIHDIPISSVLQRWNPTKVVAGVSQSRQMSDKKSSWESPATSKVGNSWEGHSVGYLHCGAPSRARVQLPRYNKLVNGVYKPAYNWGAPLCGYMGIS